LFAKKHEFEYKVILAVCDKEHVGKKFEDKEISFTTSEKFYKGKEITPEELIELLKESDSANLFGDKCVLIAVKEGFLSEQSVKKIAGISHGQIYRV